MEQALQQELADELAKAKDLTGNLAAVNADLSAVRANSLPSKPPWLPLCPRSNSI